MIFRKFLAIFLLCAWGQFAGATHFFPPQTYLPEENAQMFENNCGLYKLAYDSGEFLKYKVYYNWTAFWVPAGIATFQVKNNNLENKNLLHIVSEGRSLSSYDWFFKVYDVYESYLDPTNHQPFRFVRNVDENGFTIQQQYTFNAAKNNVKIDHEYKLGELKRSNETIAVEPCIQDMVSALYYARCIDFDSYDKGALIPMQVFVDGEPYDISIKYLGKDQIKTDFGKFNCIKISPQLIVGDIFKEEEGMVIWATDDDNKVPLYVESPLRVGKIKAYLIDYKGLKYDLAALKK
ncbi:MAG: DUF3108 domain-containing protein [Chitinophagales bacterium]|nr:DUF3108 domain-containing protein [Bacteroidota bacterium]MCB9043548.1 DUF3108 domain-containing protein [Chitinophagales bacterium]